VCKQRQISFVARVFLNPCQAARDPHTLLESEGVWHGLETRATKKERCASGAWAGLPMPPLAAAAPLN